MDEYYRTYRLVLAYLAVLDQRLDCQGPSRRTRILVLHLAVKTTTL
jgi:hypothetical protein